MNSVHRPSLLNRLAFPFRYVIPSGLLARWGMWDWHDVLSPANKHFFYQVRDWEAANSETPLPRELRRGQRWLPASRLLQRGSPFPRNKTPWPCAFNEFHHSYNTDNLWALLPIEELTVWTGIWKTHPMGQACLAKALEGCLGSGSTAHVQLLLEAGARPLPDQPRASQELATHPSAGSAASLMSYLWGGKLHRARLASALHGNGGLEDYPGQHHYKIGLWALLQRQPWAKELSFSDWVAQEAHPRIPFLPAKSLDDWRARGLPMPTGEATLQFARQTIRHMDDQYQPDLLQQTLEAAQWWLSHGSLPSHARTTLLEDWVCTMRFDVTEEHQKMARPWAELLGNPLPPSPYVSEGLPWLYLLADPNKMVCFPGSLPDSLVRRFFDDPLLPQARINGQSVATFVLESLHQDAYSSHQEDSVLRLANLLNQCVLERSLSGQIPETCSVNLAQRRPRF